MPNVQLLLDRKGNKVHSVPPETTVDRAAEIMNEHNIGSLLVVDDENLKGIITERDILRKVIAAGRKPETTSVKSVMTDNLWTCTPETSLEDISDIFKDRRVRHLPVVTDAGELAGVISIGDLNAFRLEGQAVMIEYLHQYIHGAA
ncbi:CBS domain-containing protein [Mucisphaera calidilacus]|uniref:Hypoxic response protein 1 n=1 Tax=Mucisphaera calidilacus TaxID=2527982 RepID=A0A518BYD8_9BACT|nr:CBS domain-containing protein [Mucisphaera calidilacus]QDU71991.1 Hypoxic response protein 1 [Mucisphaera calidilacus]